MVGTAHPTNMAYVVNQDIIDRVGTATAAQLTTDSGSTPDSDALDEVRLAAEGEANGYIAKRYAVPVDLSAHADLAGTLAGFVLDIAVYRLFSRRPPPADNYKTSRDEAVKWFLAISEGKVKLPAAVTPASTTSDDPAPTSGYSPSSGLGGEDGIRPW